MVMPLTYHRFTVDEYHRMGEAGIFHEDDRVELIDGQVVEMTPIGPRHAGCVKALVQILYRTAGDAVVLGVQDPVVLNPHNAPEPDIAVLRPRPHGYRARHPAPADVLLVIEVADTSVESDRSSKIPLYARAGIPEAWLVHLRADHIEVHRDATPEGYRSLRIAGRGETLSALALPHVAVPVADILG